MRHCLPRTMSPMKTAAMIVPGTSEEWSARIETPPRSNGSCQKITAIAA
jgi:hypothetical protein